jgi:hypothetical protein
MKFCPYCGAQIVAVEGQFCHACGRELPASSAAVDIETRPTPDSLETAPLPVSAAETASSSQATRMPAFFWVLLALLCIFWVGIWMPRDTRSSPLSTAPLYAIGFTGCLMAYWFKRTGKGQGWGFLSGLLFGISLFTLPLIAPVVLRLFAH